MATPVQTPQSHDLNVISLSFIGSQVMAKFLGPHSQDIKTRLLSDTFPTAFTINTPMDSVISEISRLNPDCLVCWHFDQRTTLAVIEVK